MPSSASCSQTQEHTSMIHLLSTASTTLFLLYSRANFFRKASFLTAAALIMPFSFHTNTAIALLDSVYGPVIVSDDRTTTLNPAFPLPLPKEEAGPCANGHQRRYLWTDAFGVLAYTSLADQMRHQQDDTGTAELYEQAAHRLVQVVHECLGTPRSLSKKEDAMTRDDDSPTGYVGLRIGKVESRAVTDYGMHYDGQYWHYVDKWLLALARSGHVREGIAMAKSVFPFFFDAGPNGDGRGGGIRWKLSVDATPPPELQRAHASDDTLVALITFSLLESLRSDDDDDDMPSLQSEIELLTKSLQDYRPRVTDDPLGWGLECIYDQFLQGQPRSKALRSIHRQALHPSHMSLPFRLYGAMIGARVAGESVAPAMLVTTLVDKSVQHEMHAMEHGKEDHSSINRVMLAMCLLCPGALGRRPGDPLIDL